MGRYPLLVILGPTAVGKTELSLKIAQETDGEIISADSMQIYKEMDIGTAKVSEIDQKSIKHHMIDILNPDFNFSVADYKEKVDKIIPEIIKRDHLPILAGGTGLYIKAVIDGFLFPDMNKDYELRKKLKEYADKYGNKYIHNKLKKIDPQLAENVHPNDIKRVIRGIEVYKQTGKTLTHYKKLQKKRPDRYNALKIGLKRNRQELYKRINKRVDIMLEKGLIEEVKKLLNNGYNISSTAMQGLGYKEIIGYLEGEYDLKEAIRILKRDTRRFAKRQISWFKRDPEIKWFNLSCENKMIVYKEILKLIYNNLLS